MPVASIITAAFTDCSNFLEQTFFIIVCTYCLVSDTMFQNTFDYCSRQNREEVLINAFFFL